MWKRVVTTSVETVQAKIIYGVNTGVKTYSNEGSLTHTVPGVGFQEH